MALVPDYPVLVKGMSLSSNEVVANISAHKTNSVGVAPFLEDIEMSTGR